MVNAHYVSVYKPKLGTFKSRCHLGVDTREAYLEGAKREGFKLKLKINYKKGVGTVYVFECPKNGLVILEMEELDIHSLGGRSFPTRPTTNKEA